jgi:hypothetical protein
MEICRSWYQFMDVIHYNSKPALISFLLFFYICGVPTKRTDKEHSSANLIQDISSLKMKGLYSVLG